MLTPQTACLRPSGCRWPISNKACRNETHLQKEPPKKFLEFLRQRPHNWESIHDGGPYRLCRDHILTKKQFGLGAYTEKPLSNSKNIHIDHFRKKGMSWKPDVTFRWENLFVEDRNQNYGACYKDSHTHDKNDYRLLLNPADDYPEHMTTYMFNGKIKARTDLTETEREKVEFTIERFNLNHLSLCNMRREIIEQVMACKQFSDDEIRQFMQESGFPTVVEWALGCRH